MKILFMTGLIILFSVSCSVDSDSAQGDDVAVEPASASEQVIIEETLTEIAALAKGHGVERDFKKLPVFVANTLNVAGLCKKNSGGAGLYIAVSRDVLNAPKPLGERTSELFDVLLHEIGHCYFNREHEDGVIAVPGQLLVFKVPNKISAPLVYREVPISIMISAGGDLLPQSLKPYYVGEILGLVKARSYDDLKPYVAVDLREAREGVKQEEPLRRIFD